MPLADLTGARNVESRGEWMTDSRTLGLSFFADYAMADATTRSSVS